MSVLPIRAWPDPCLARICAPVSDPGAVETLAADMLETMYAAPGRGLAGPQVGEMLRLFVMDAGWKDGTSTPRVCINPEILSQGAQMVGMTEGCLSVPGVTAEVMRPAEIVLRYTGPNGAVQEVALEGAEARVAQHEMDHLDGIMHFDRLEAAARADLLKRYEAVA